MTPEASEQHRPKIKFSSKENLTINIKWDELYANVTFNYKIGARMTQWIMFNMAPAAASVQYK